jgi:NADH-quinone oxidoreductase subunit I
VRSLSNGLLLTWRHIRRAFHRQKPLSIANTEYFADRTGLATIQYPHEVLPVPDTGRYRLHNEIDDCIVCDKCVKICPVNCITTDPIKAVAEFGKTSDGTPKRIYAAAFDIDMGKCCFCGLCTTVCPTECLTMTKVYDFSVFDIREHQYAFADMTPELIAEKKKELEEAQRQKAETKTEGATPQPSASSAGPKPAFKPRIKPPPATS